MYSPAYALQNNQAENERIIRENPFATIVYSQGDVPEAFHLPLYLEEGKLIGHIARANTAWKALDGRSALFIFHGPHTYISPEFYGTDNNVPTWNYISVHVRGKVRITEDETFLRRALKGLSAIGDPSFNIEENIGKHSRLLLGIVGIEVAVESTVGKFKLAQSKPESERRNVIEALEKKSSDQSRAVADEMRKTLVTEK